MRDRRARRLPLKSLGALAGALALAIAIAPITTSAPRAAAATGDGGVYAVTDLGALEPDGTSGPAAMNQAGDVAGTASLDLASRAFLRDDTAMRDLGVLPGMTQSGANDLSDTGLVAGWSTSANMVGSRAVLFDGTTQRDLGDLGGGSAVAIGVSDGGVVVGSATTASGARHGFRWENGTMVDLNDVLPLTAGTYVEDGTRVDDAGRIIGRLHLASGEIVGYWFDGTTVQPVRLAPGDFTNVTAFSRAGVAGTSSSGVSGSRAFVWRDGQATELPGIAGDACTDARDIDGHGRVVGTSSGCGRGSTRAVLWQEGRAVDLQALVDPGAGWRLRNATAINDLGAVAAVALDPDGRSHAVVLRPRHRATLVAGADRTATAIDMGKAVPLAESSTAVLARADSPADAAVAAVLAARRQAPLLLTGPAGLEDRVAAAVTAHVWRGGTVVIVGGSAAVGTAVQDRLLALGFEVDRLGGADRDETAVRVAEAAGGPGPVVLVSREALDAAAAIPVAVHQRAALLYTAGATLPPATRRYLDARPGWARVAIGRAAGADPTATTIAGADRVITAVLVAERFFPSPAAVVLASVASAIDGALAGRLAASAGAPALLTESPLSTSPRDYLASRPLLAGAVTVGALAATGVTDAVDLRLGASARRSLPADDARSTP